MSTTTVPAGATASVSLIFSTVTTASLAKGLLASVYTSAAGNNLVVYPQPTVAGGVNEFVVTVAGAVTVPAGYGIIIDAVTSGTVTITGNGASDESVVAGAGNFVYIPTGGSGTVVAGAGTDTIQNPTLQTGSGYTLEGDAEFSNEISNLYGETISNSGTFTYSEFQYLPTFYYITNTAPGPTLVNLNAYAETVSALSNGGIYNDNSYLTFINGGANTVVASASAKPATIFGGNFNMQVVQGTDTATIIFVNGSANSTISAGPAGGMLAFNGAGGTINLSDSQSSAFNYLVGGSGAETLNAAATTDTAVLVAGQANASATFGSASVDAFFGGTGASTIVGGIASSGAALPDLYAFAKGSSGGSDLILNWGTASGLVFLGYSTAGDAAIKAALAAAPTNASTVSLTLPDNTNIPVSGLNGAIVNLNNNPVYLG